MSIRQNSFDSGRRARISIGETFLEEAVGVESSQIVPDGAFL